jgi:hypothetical protein
MTFIRPTYILTIKFSIIYKIEIGLICVPGSNGVTEAHQEQEANPVQQEGEHKCCTENNVVAQERCITFILSPGSRVARAW